MARGRGRGRGDWSVGTPGGIQEVTYTVPADKCGLVIGKGRPCCEGLALPLWQLGLKADRPHVQYLRSTRFTLLSTLDQRGQAQGCRGLPRHPPCLGLLTSQGTASTSSPCGNRCYIRETGCLLKQPGLLEMHR